MIPAIGACENGNVFIATHKILRSVTVFADQWPNGKWKAYELTERCSFINWDPCLGRVWETWPECVQALFKMGWTLYPAHRNYLTSKPEKGKSVTKEVPFNAIAYRSPGKFHGAHMAFRVSTEFFNKWGMSRTKRYAATYRSPVMGLYGCIVLREVPDTAPGKHGQMTFSDYTTKGSGETYMTAQCSSKHVSFFNAEDPNFYGMTPTLVSLQTVDGSICFQIPPIPERVPQILRGSKRPEGAKAPKVKTPVLTPADHLNSLKQAIRNVNLWRTSVEGVNLYFKPNGDLGAKVSVVTEKELD